MTRLFKLMDPTLAGRAEYQSEELGRITGLLEAMCWDLDSALSLARKGEDDKGTLEAATIRAAFLLRALGPAVDLARRWDAIETYAGRGTRYYHAR